MNTEDAFTEEQALQQSLNGHIGGVGIVGLGTMGAAMALNLLKAGIDLTVFNRTALKCEPFAERGVAVADSVADLATRVDTVLLSLPNEEAVFQSVYQDGIRDHGKTGLTVVDSSTIHPHASQELCAALGAKGIHYLDAPVTGSRNEAEKGTLGFLVGGDKEVFETLIPLFEILGQRQFYLGESGMGSCAKLGNNMMGAIHMAAFSEAMSLVESYGLDRQNFYNIISQSGARSAVVEGKGTKILSDFYEPDFALGLMLKDVRLASRMAYQCNHPAPLLEAAERVFGLAAEQYADKDMCSLYQWYAQSAVTRMEIARTEEDNQ